MELFIKGNLWEKKQIKGLEAKVQVGY